MNFHKLISTLFHPIMIPTIGTLVYFMLIPINFETTQKLSVLAVIFTCTYFIPLLVIVLFKKLKLISSFDSPKTKERKLPILLMTILFYTMASFFYKIPTIRDLGILFYATTGTLILAFLITSFKFKMSIHMMSLGLMVGFFMMMNKAYSHQFLTITIISFIIAGLVANARIGLKAHQPNEVYVGFFVGFITTIATSIVLQ